MSMTQMDLMKLLAGAMSQSSGNSSAHGGKSMGGIRIIGADLNYADYGVAKEDLDCWRFYIRGRNQGNNKSNALRRIIEEKIHLLTQRIGNPNDPNNKYLRNSENPYGNSILHDCIVNACDESVVKPSDAILKINGVKAILENQKNGLDFLLRYFESRTKEKGLKVVEKCIIFLDAQQKTPLLLACKALNEKTAMRLLALDQKKLTINLPDKIKKQTPLHIACIYNLTNVAEKLLEMRADNNVVDADGHTPSYFLTCSPDEAKKAIRETLESVNFFFPPGVFGQPGADEMVINAVLARRADFVKKMGPLLLAKKPADDKETLPTAGKALAASQVLPAEVKSLSESKLTAEAAGRNSNEAAGIAAGTNANVSPAASKDTKLIFSSSKLSAAAATGASDQPPAKPEAAAMSAMEKTKKKNCSNCCNTKVLDFVKKCFKRSWS